MPRPGSKQPMDGVPVVSTISELQAWLSRELGSKFQEQQLSLYEQQVALNRALEETLRPINLVYEAMDERFLAETNGTAFADDEQEEQQIEMELDIVDGGDADFLPGVNKQVYPEDAFPREEQAEELKKSEENGACSESLEGKQLEATKESDYVEPTDEEEVQSSPTTRSKVSRRQLKTMSMLQHGLDGKPHFSTSSRLRKFILGPLDFYMGLIVSVNVIVMCASAQLQGLNADASLGNTEEVTWNANTMEILERCEYGFFAIYTSDLLLRTIVLRWDWLYTEVEGIMYLNLFDGFLVLLNTIEIVVLPAFGGNEDIEQSSGNVRILKLMRLTRALRIVRTIHVFQPLRVLIITTIASMGALFWSMVLLLMLQMTAGLVITQSLHGYVIDTNNDLDMRVWVNQRYGDFFKTMYTTFEITYSGGWPGYVRPVVERVNAWYALLFLGYVAFVVFAMIRIITALFIKETLACAARDAEIALEERKKAGEEYRNKLEDFFSAADTDGNGTISVIEFNTALANPTIINYLSLLGLNVKEVEPLFSLLDDGDGLVTIEEFCSGVTHLKGEARALDVTILKHDLHKVMRMVKDVRRELFAIFHSMSKTGSQKGDGGGNGWTLPAGSPATSLSPRSPAPGK